MWEVYGIDLRNPHLFSPSPSPSSPSSSSSPSSPNSTIIHTGLDIFFTVTFVNKKSGIRQIGAACNMTVALTKKLQSWFVSILDTNLDSGLKNQKTPHTTTGMI